MFSRNNNHQPSLVREKKYLIMNIKNNIEYRWAKLQGKWTVVKIDKNGHYIVIGSEEIFSEQCFEEVGEKIKPPEPIHEHEWIRCTIPEIHGETFLFCSCGQFTLDNPMRDAYRNEIVKKIRTAGAIIEVVE